MTCEICGLNRDIYVVFVKNDGKYYTKTPNTTHITLDVCFDCYTNNKAIMK